jgi:peroxiredoxin/predicted 2-oxoglutarate/Fe(II)-dependent dioxygenase YbiX
MLGRPRIRMRHNVFPIRPLRTLTVGEPAPFFVAATDGVAQYSLDVAAGRWIVLMMLGTLSEAASKQAHDLVISRRRLFNDADAAFYGVTADPMDRSHRGLANSDPGLRYFWDFDAAVARLYGVADAEHLKPTIFLIDPSFRIAMVEPVENAGAVLDRLAQELRDAPALEDSPFAPVLILPRILEPELCAELIGYYRHGRPTPSGFAHDIDGRTYEAVDTRLKRRQDVTIEGEALIEAVRTRLETRVFPMLKRARGWQAKYIERYLICRYAETDRGFFFPHRDDVTAGTAHRKFAVSLNLNAEDHQGGDLRFPEFGRRTYRPPTGGAAVFCGSLLHEATPVTKGERFAVVPFLYDEDGAKLRRTNLVRLGDRGSEPNRKARRSGRR